MIVIYSNYIVIMRYSKMLLCAGVCLAFVAGALAAGYARSPHGAADVYAMARRPIIRHLMADAGKGQILLAGDSHMELFPSNPLMCGRRVVNAGVSGANAAVYGRFMDGLDLSHAHAVILTMGTNDLLRKARATPERFRGRVAPLLQQASRQVAVLVVTAIPPISETLRRLMQIEQVGVFSGILRETCAQLPNCLYIDPFAPIRDPHQFGLAVDGAMSDGLHVAGYERFLTPQTLCPALERCPVNQDRLIDQNAQKAIKPGSSGVQTRS